MRPALSIIFFTTLSGAGYGLWFLIGAGLACGVYPLGRGVVLVPLATGLVLTGAGLLASVAHLGQPQRAWRAFSQWRSSWLSREGVMALACVPIALVLAVCARADHHQLVERVAGGLLALTALVTVFCTARIYSSLKTIHAWHNSWVLPSYWLLALETGALWFWALLAGRRVGEGAGAAVPDTTLPWLLVLLALLLATALSKFGYWRFVDRSHSPATPESATGLGSIGKVQGFERPHTEENYLTHEMGFVLARRHATTLRSLARHLLLVAPAFLIGIALLLPRAEAPAAVLAALAASVGVFIERWLFFAEARHVVTLYYGARSA